MKTIDKIRLEARALLANAHGSHDWDHTERVLCLCMHIGKIEKANQEVLRVAALLHDIGREEETRSKGKICHAERGSEMAKKIMRKYDTDESIIRSVCHCIEVHRLSRGKQPETIEAKVLFDADTLDSIGAIGLGRLFFFASMIGARVHNNKIENNEDWKYGREDTAYKYFLEKQRDVPKRMLTAEGKKMAEDRYQFMLNFFERANKEAKGVL